jgi:putative PIN family toxin of toxin-antitoxin system
MRTFQPGSGNSDLLWMARRKDLQVDRARQSSPKSLLVYSPEPIAARSYPMTPAAPAVDAPRVVLDTNVVLDWLLFRDQGVLALTQAIESRSVQWVSCPRMREELTRTLGYANLAKWLPDSERLLASFDRWALVLPDPVGTLPLLRCSDPDDQVFLDLAVAAQARWLISHDRALLRLARRAKALGVGIARPVAFAAEAART